MYFIPDQKTQDVRWTTSHFQGSNLSGINAVKEKFLVCSVSADLMTKDVNGKESSDNWRY